MAIDFNALYQNNLGRAPDAKGLDYWQGLLTNGFTPDQVKDAFYNAAAKEMQRDDTGLSANVDAYDERRIADGMRLFDDLDDKFGSSMSYYNNAGDTLKMSAAERLGSLPQTYFDGQQGGSQVAQPAPQNTTPAYMQNLGMPSKPQLKGYDQQNPYLGQMANTITGQVNENLMRNVMPQINSAAMGAGQFGGSRQGVVQANALNDANKQLSNALTGMYYGDYNNQMNRNLQQYGMDQGYNLGLGRLYEGARQFDAQNQLAQDQFGFGAAMQLNNYNNGLANLGLGMGQDIYNQPLNYYNQFQGMANGLAGQGNTASQNFSGNPLMGAMGGAMLGGQMGNIFSNQGANSYGSVPGGYWNSNGQRVNNPSAFGG